MVINIKYLPLSVKAPLKTSHSSNFHAIYKIILKCLSSVSSLSLKFLIKIDSRNLLTFQWWYWSYFFSDKSTVVWNNLHKFYFVSLLQNKEKKSPQFMENWVLWRKKKKKFKRQNVSHDKIWNKWNFSKPTIPCVL